MNSPIKISFKTELFSFLIILASIIFGFYFYTHFPSQVVTHWNLQGQPNGYMNRFSASVFLPLMIVVLYFIFLFFPYLDPRHDRYASFAKVYNLFRNLILFVMFLIFLITSFYNLGYNISIEHTVPVIVGLLLVIMGNYLGKVKSNWFIGVRTPWTLSSEEVWNKTNRMSGRLMMLFGLIVIVMPFLPQVLGITLFVIGIILITFGSIVYSYVLYRNEQKTK